MTLNFVGKLSTTKSTTIICDTNNVMRYIKIITLICSLDGCLITESMLYRLVNNVSSEFPLHEAGLADSNGEQVLAVTCLITFLTKPVKERCEV